MPLDEPLIAGKGIKDFRDTMTNVVANDVFDEEGREQYAYAGIDEIQEVALRGDEALGEEAFDGVDEKFQQVGSQPR